MKNNLGVKELHIDKANYTPIATVKQEDNITMTLELYKEGVAFDITGQTVTLAAKRVDKVIIEQIDGFTIDTNRLTIDLKNNINAKIGLVYLELNIKDSIGSMTTLDFYLKVAGKILGEDSLDASNNIASLEKIQQDFINSSNSLLDTVTRNENTRVNAEVIRENNENTRNENEKGRTKAESNRVTEETNRVEAENLRATAEEKRVAADILRDEKVEKFGSQVTKNTNKFDSVFNTLYNLSKQNSVGKNYSFASDGSGTMSTALSEVVTLEQGTYFGYMEITVTDLKNYISGNVGLRFIHSKVGECLECIAGNNIQPFVNGKIILYGNFKIETAGTVKAVLRYWNPNGAITFNFIVDKLYLFKDIDYKDILTTLKERSYSELISILNYKIQNKNLENNSVSYEKLDNSIKDLINKPVEKIINCWGDSLMAGAGGNGISMPSELQKKLGQNYIVNNYGQGGENAEEIAFRQGGLLAYVEPFTLKKDATFTENLNVTSIDGMQFTNLNLQGTYFGNNFVWINGIKCLFRRSENGKFRIAIGEGISKDEVFTKKQLLITEGFKDKSNSILLICIGQNGWKTNNPSDLCKIIKRMLDKNKTEKYLIISRPSGNFESMKNEELEFALNFGNNFFNAREYLSQNGLADNNLTANQEDLNAMEIGAIPPQLKSDVVHGNSYFYKSYANGVYEALKNIL